MVRVLLTPAAKADLVDAVAWYDARAPEIAPQFLETVWAALPRIAENPKQFPPSAFQTRRALLRRFPYLVIFRERGDAAYVVAIFHTSRDPRVWRQRTT
jgi:plasmid stabilization system protein ParE